MRANDGLQLGARSAFKLKEQSYLRNMLSRRQLQGFVGLRCTRNLALRNTHTRQERLRIMVLSHLNTLGGFNHTCLSDWQAWL
jgi:hypothetical protein